jgi:hypothetical protein
MDVMEFISTKIKFKPNFLFFGVKWEKEIIEKEKKDFYVRVREIDICPFPMILIHLTSIKIVRK